VELYPIANKGNVRVRIAIMVPSKLAHL